MTNVSRTIMSQQRQTSTDSIKQQMRQVSMFQDELVIQQQQIRGISSTQSINPNFNTTTRPG